MALSRPKHGFESRRGRQLHSAYFRPRGATAGQASPHAKAAPPKLRRSEGGLSLPVDLTARTAQASRTRRLPRPWLRSARLARGVEFVRTSLRPEAQFLPLPRATISKFQRRHLKTGSGRAFAKRHFVESLLHQGQLRAIRHRDPLRGAASRRSARRPGRRGRVYASCAVRRPSAAARCRGTDTHSRNWPELLWPKLLLTPSSTGVH